MLSDNPGILRMQEVIDRLRGTLDRQQLNTFGTFTPGPWVYDRPTNTTINQSYYTLDGTSLGLDFETSRHVLTNLTDAPATPDFEMEWQLFAEEILHWAV